MIAGEVVAEKRVDVRRMGMVSASARYIQAERMDLRVETGRVCVHERESSAR